MSKPGKATAFAFAATVFSGAALGFLVQPLLGKRILPWFGGVPAVWTACLLFFQTALLLGYAYAHALSRLPLRRQALIHGAMVAAALALLGLHAASWPSPVTPPSPPGGAGPPVASVLLLLARSVGLPYAVLSATSPLLMRWSLDTEAAPGGAAEIASAKSPATREPYWLYSLSNAGSLLGLLAYPLAVEPWLPVPTQGAAWAAAFAAYAAGMLACGLFAARSPSDNPAAETADGSPLRARDVASWIALSALGCAALLAVTNQLCQEIAVVPFLWVLPLTLYLLSLILCFGSERWARPLPWAAALLLSPVACHLLLGDALFKRFLAQLAILSALLFAVVMLAHGELARRRPAAAHLTAYTLAIAGGGVLGGLAVAVVAPLVFPAFWEFHVTLLLAQLLAAGVLLRESAGRRIRGRVPLRPVVAGVQLLVLASLLVVFVGDVKEHLASSVQLSRSFYGTLRVLEHYENDPLLHQYELRHGSTTHGYQLRTPQRRFLATSYYAEGSGIARAFTELRARRPDRGSNVGLVGLGVGTLLTYTRPGDTVRVYELDPDVARLSTQRRPLFTFLKERGQGAELVLGDARLSLERQLAEGRPAGFHLLALDAFSSDSIPAHLLTVEAFRVYLAHLDADGLLAVHISNRHLDLTPVLWAAAERLSLHAGVFDVAKAEPWTERSIWILLSRRPLFQGTTLAAAGKGPSVDARRILWTDTRSDLLRLLRR